MTLSISLSPELERSVKDRAATLGQDLNGFVLSVIEEKLVRSSRVEDICGPIAEAVSASGISDSEFQDLVDEAREESWRARHPD